MVAIHHRIFLLVTLFLAVSSHVVAPNTPEEDNYFMYVAAQQEYAKAFKGQMFEPQRDGIMAYDHLPNLKSDALTLAEGTGNMKGAMLIGAKGAHRDGSRAIWFSTVIHHGDDLGRQMRLGNKLALAFWRLDSNGKKLLFIDTVPDPDVRLGLEDLNKVLRRFKR